MKKVKIKIIIDEIEILSTMIPNFLFLANFVVVNYITFQI